MRMAWRRETLDMILVPLSLFVMFVYHLFLLYRCLRNPNRTVVGYENHNRRVWVERMYEIDPKDRPATSVLGNNISAASNLTSISLVLSSLIGAWLGSSDKNFFTSSSFIYGDTSASIITLKYVSLLICFLVAFSAFVQATRCYVHASYLITIPNVEVPVTYTEREVIRGSNFYEIGMRALYFASTFLMWAFGPIPMFISSVITVLILHTLDTNTKPPLQFPMVNHGIQKKSSHDTSAVITARKHQEIPQRWS